MRHRPADPNTALVEGVDILLRRFRALGIDDRLPTAGTPPSGKSPIEPTYYVASIDERHDLRAVADWVCSGTNDDVEIKAALAAVSYGRVVLSGRYWLADETVITVSANCTLEGSGEPSAWLIPEGDVTFNLYGLMVDVMVAGEGC